MWHAMTIPLMAVTLSCPAFCQDDEGVCDLAIHMITHDGSAAVEIQYDVRALSISEWHERIIPLPVYENLGSPTLSKCYTQGDIDYVMQSYVDQQGKDVVILDTQPAVMILVAYQGPAEGATSAAKSLAEYWFGQVLGLESLAERPTVREGVRLFATDNLPPGNHGAKDGLVAVLHGGRMGIMALKALEAWTDAQTETYAFSMMTSHWFFPMHRKGP